ncbi:lasso peptide biosynthesis protein [Streptomyces sp. NPDC018019]|uniref:lasso peptide biosynthesis protein n=1 Tax=Streptomyces sp. NPDC018019 TaxID=3365030 RepID=UPI0037BCE3F8
MTDAAMPDPAATDRGTAHRTAAPRPTADWAFLLWGDGAAGPAPRTSPAARLTAAAHTARALRDLSRHGWGAAQTRLRDLPVAPGAHRSLPEATALRVARRELPRCQLVIRLAAPNALCLARSFGLAVYLSAIGLPAETVIARQRSSIGARFAFHSWTELYGEVLNDVPVVQSGHTVLQRVGCAALH